VPNVPDHWEAVGKAAAVAGVTVAELTAVDEHRAAAELFTTAFGTTAEHAPLSPHLLRAFALADCYVAGARRDGELVGACAGFRTRDGLFSQTAGVLPGIRSAGVGFALKQHQRAWALDRGIRTVEWTFDPLVRRNAHFNLAKLGATAVGYLPDCYGAMADGLNSGDLSDRCLVRWELAAPATIAAAAGSPLLPSVPALLAAGTPVVLDLDGAGEPLPGAPTGAQRRLCRIPPDVLGLRAEDPAAALRWRLALRAALSTAMADGLAATGIDHDGWYLLERRPREDP
jgi:predicted GNAT superfamily acetyltransferase